MSSERQLANELADKIHQFFQYQIRNNSDIPESAKESLSVASECLEQAYKLQTKPASNELLDIYKAHKDTLSASTNNTSSSTPTSQSRQPNATGLGGDPNVNLPSFLQQFAGTILNQATNVAAGAAASAAAAAAASALNSRTEQPTVATTASPGTQSATAPRAPKQRKQATQSEKLAAESFKTQGNTLMREDRYAEAYESYTKAIEIDDNNAIYYSNRAAALSKLDRHDEALKDCQEALEIDPNYSKAHGRLGLVYASFNDHKKARDAYVKAVELDPTNESYRSNLQIAEENIRDQEAAGGAATGATGNGDNMNFGGLSSILSNMVNNPQLMNMAMRTMQDPRLLNMFNPATQQAGSQGQQQSQQQQQQQRQQQPQQPQQQQATPADDGTGPEAFNIGGIGQLLSGIGSNPELMANMGRLMNQFMSQQQQQQQPPNNDNSDRNPPPGYSWSKCCLW